MHSSLSIYTNILILFLPQLLTVSFLFILWRAQSINTFITLTIKEENMNLNSLKWKRNQESPFSIHFLGGWSMHCRDG